MTQSAPRRRGIFARMAPALAGLMIAGGLAFVAAAPASATPTTPPATVSDENIDASALVQPEGTDKGKKTNDCQGDTRCTPIKWCDGKVVQGKPSANAIVEDGQDKPECLKVPSAHIDDKDCCKAPPGGTIIIAIYNPNSVSVPVQVTVKSGDKERTKDGWAKPGKTVIKLKKLKNGQYEVIVHLFDCVFKHGHKVVKIECKDVTPSTSPTVSPSVSPSVSVSPSQSPSASPSATSPAPGVGGGSNNGGGGELAQTGSDTKYWVGGSGLVAAGAVLFLLAMYNRRRQVSFTAE